VTAESREFLARVTADGRARSSPCAVYVDERGVSIADGPSGPLRIEFGDVASISRGDLEVRLALFDGKGATFDRGGSLDDLWEALRKGFLASTSASLRFAPADPRHVFDARVSLEGPGGFRPLAARGSPFWPTRGRARSCRSGRSARPLSTATPMK